MKMKLWIASALIMSASASANAEDDNSYYYDQQQTNPYKQADTVYQMPPSYDGQYYPYEQEPVAGYYGTQKNSKNQVSNDIRDNPDGYYNYYY